MPIAGSAIGKDGLSDKIPGSSVVMSDPAERIARSSVGSTGLAEGVPGSTTRIAETSEGLTEPSKSVAGLSEGISESSGSITESSAVMDGLSGSSTAIHAGGYDSSFIDDSGYQMPSGEIGFSNTEITGGHISTTAVTPDGKEASVDLYNAAQYEKPSSPYSVVSASDGSQWYQIASGEGMGSFYQTPQFTGDVSEAVQAASAFPGMAEGTSLRTVGDGVIEASHQDGGSSLWYSSAHYQEPDAPHDNIRASDGVGWYAMHPRAATPYFENETFNAADIGAMPHGGSPGADISGQREFTMAYNRAQFQNFMPGYEEQVSHVNPTRSKDGLIEVRHANGSGTAFYDKTMYQAPRGDHKVYEDARGGQWYAVPGTPTVERRPVYEGGKPVYDGDKLRTVNVENIRYKSTLNKFEGLKKRDVNDRKPPNLKKR